MESKLAKHDDLEADKGVSKTADKDQSGGETSRRKPPPSDYSAEVSHIISEGEIPEIKLKDLKGLMSRLQERNRNLWYGRSEGSKERKGSEADEGRSEGSKRKKKRRKGSDDSSRIWRSNTYERLKRERVEIIRKIKMIIPGFKDDFRRPDLYRVYVPVTEGIVKEQDVPPETDLYLVVEAKTKKSLEEACFGAKKMVELIIRQKKRRKMRDEGLPFVSQLSLRGFALTPGSPLPPVASPPRTNPPSGGQLPNPPPVPPVASPARGSGSSRSNPPSGEQLPNPPPVPPPAPWGPPPGPYAQPVATQQYANLSPQHYAYLSQYYAHLYQHYASAGKLPPVASPAPWAPPPGSYHPPPPPMPSMCLKELEAKLMQDAIEASLSQLSLDSRPHQQGFAKHRKSTSF